MIHNAVKEDRKLSVVTVDIAKAYDNVDHKILKKCISKWFKEDNQTRNILFFLFERYKVGIGHT